MKPDYKVLEDSSRNLAIYHANTGNYPKAKSYLDDAQNFKDISEGLDGAGETVLKPVGTKDEEESKDIKLGAFQ